MFPAAEYMSHRIEADLKAKGPIQHGIANKVSVVPLRPVRVTNGMFLMSLRMRTKKDLSWVIIKRV